MVFSIFVGHMRIVGHLCRLHPAADTSGYAEHSRSKTYVGSHEDPCIAVHGVPFLMVTMFLFVSILTSMQNICVGKSI